MRKTLVTPATFDVFTVAQVKARPELRIASSVDDAVIADMIESAVEAYEEFTENILRLSTFDLYFDGFPVDRKSIETPGPLVAVESVNYLDSETSPSDMTAIDPAKYIVDITDPMCGRIALAGGNSWGTPVAEQINNVRVRATIGYANAAEIPRRIKDGLLLKMQEIYYGSDLRMACEACWSRYLRHAL